MPALTHQASYVAQKGIMKMIMKNCLNIPKIAQRLFW